MKSYVLKELRVMEFLFLVKDPKSIWIFQVVTLCSFLKQRESRDWQMKLADMSGNPA